MVFASTLEILSVLVRAPSDFCMESLLDRSSRLDSSTKTCDSASRVAKWPEQLRVPRPTCYRARKHETLERARHPQSKSRARRAAVPWIVQDKSRLSR